MKTTIKILTTVGTFVLGCILIITTSAIPSTLTDASSLPFYIGAVLMGISGMYGIFKVIRTIRT